MQGTSSSTAKKTKGKELEELVLDEYDSDAGGNCKGKKLRQVYDSSSSEEDEEDDHVRKIYYVSRTHTQLNQFVGEVKGTPFGERLRVVRRERVCEG